MDVTFLVKLTSKAWALPILAQMGAGVPGRQAALQSATGASRTAFGQSLSHLIDLRVVEKNPGHGHPLRPEYQLTPLGTALAPGADAIVEMSQDTTHPTLIRRMWILPLLASLQEPQTFSGLATTLTPITDRALSQALQHLQTADWITRDVDISSRPPRATYQSHRIGAAMGQHCLALLQAGHDCPARLPAVHPINPTQSRPLWVDVQPDSPKATKPVSGSPSAARFSVAPHARPAPPKEDEPMSRVCELTGKGPMTGNNVSHANNKTRRRFLPNLNETTLQSESLGRSFKLRISAHALRSVDHRGGLDKFLAKAKDADLSANALKIKKAIKKAGTGAEALS